MKKSRQYIAGLLLLFIMALASGCGDGRDSAKSTEGTKQSQSAASAQNGPTNAGSSMADDMDMGNEESTGVLDGLADDVREGMDDIRDAAEGSIGASGEISPR